MISGCRSQIQHEVTLSNNLRVMFNNDDRILDVPEFLHYSDEPVIIPGMEADAWFIQDIEGIDQGRAKGRCEGYPLQLTT